MYAPPRVRGTNVSPPDTDFSTEACLQVLVTHFMIMQSPQTLNTETPNHEHSNPKSLIQTGRASEWTVFRFSATGALARFLSASLFLVVQIMKPCRAEKAVKAPSVMLACFFQAVPVGFGFLNAASMWTLFLGARIESFSRPQNPFKGSTRSQWFRAIQGIGFAVWGLGIK